LSTYGIPIFDEDFSQSAAATAVRVKGFEVKAATTQK